VGAVLRLDLATGVKSALAVARTVEKAFHAAAGMTHETHGYPWPTPEIVLGIERALRGN